MGKVMILRRGLDTSDATATASKILSGYTAYTKGAKVTGTHRCPTLASMTSTATATAADIKSGKTAYVSGTKLIGTNVPISLVSFNLPYISSDDRFTDSRLIGKTHFILIRITDSGLWSENENRADIVYCISHDGVVNYAYDVSAVSNVLTFRRIDTYTFDNTIGKVEMGGTYGLFDGYYHIVAW